jgi:hypothetical protein
VARDAGSPLPPRPEPTRQPDSHTHCLDALAWLLLRMVDQRRAARPVQPEDTAPIPAPPPPPPGQPPTAPI